MESSLKQTGLVSVSHWMGYKLITVALGGVELRDPKLNRG